MNKKYRIIPIGNIEYKVYLKRLSKSVAEIDYEKQCINLNKAYDKQAREEALCHEILHAILYHSGVELKHRQEEKLVRNMENVFYRFLTGNTNFFS